MIEIFYYYTRKDGKIMQYSAIFTNVQKAVRFMYKLKNHKKYVFTGEFTCDDPWDTDYINSHFR